MISSVLLTSLSTSNVLDAHSGGLNAQGCHAGSQPYHCHRPQAQPPKPGPSQNSSLGNRERVSGKITQVRDGDTFVLSNLPIRLAAVDCPENNTLAGQNASDFISSFLGEIATCELTGAITYDRSVAYCSIGGRDVGMMLFANTECRVWERYDVWDRY